MTPQDIKETHISDLYNIDHCTHVQKPMIVTKGNNSYNWPLALTFLAHLSRRLIGELIVYRSSRRPSVRECVRPSVNTFKHEYICNQLADWNEILSEASLG